VFLPAKTPRDIVNEMHEESRKALLVPAVQERIAKTGNEPMTMTVDAFFKADVRSTAKLM
jgi:tripartite-type tricarboxylate transporter receptor subunit TctC